MARRGNDGPPRVDAAKLNHYPLSSEILADLTDAFKYYDKEDTGVISTTHFRNILHNFGFHRMTKKEIDEELKGRHDIDPNKRTVFDFDCVRLAVAFRWNKGGKEDEARECFKLFEIF